MYKLVKDPIEPEFYVIKRLLDSVYIPVSDSNYDYKEYLEWLEEGNTPEPADDPSTPE